jgi:hypothetical protein
MAITVQEAQVVFSADGMRQVDTQSRRASSAMDGLTAAAKRVGSALSGIKSAFSGLGGTLATLGATAGLVKMAQLTMDAEKTAISFEVLTGSVHKAKTLLQDLRDLDKKTVFGLTDLATAQKLMMNFGLGIEESFSLLQNLTEVAQGDSEQLMLLAKAMAQVKAAGRLMGQEANQLINSGFSPLFEISQMTGRGMADLKKDMENGLISYDMVRQALERLTTGTGRLAGMNDRLSQTTGGMLSKFMTNIEQLSIAIGNSFLPVANDVLEALNGISEAAGAVASPLKIMVADLKAAVEEQFILWEDLGITIGVVFSNLPRLLSDIMSDLATRVKELLAYTVDAGKAIATNLSPGVMFGGQKAVEVPTLEFSPMVARGSLREAVQAELDFVRGQRIAERKAEASAAFKEQQKLQKPERQAAPPLIPMVDESLSNAVTQAAQIAIERGGALQVFQRLQDQLSPKKTEDLQKQQIDLAKESLKVQQAISAGITGLPLVPILG